MKIFDRYSFLCISVAAILIMAALMNENGPAGGNEEKEKNIVGIVFDVRTTQNGYTFSFEDAIGGKIRCFSRAEPHEFGEYFIKGTFSSDGGMFFVDRMEPVRQNETPAGSLE
jgi:DNA polymerase II small subunit/DNA polymerase delta subunit B